MIIGVTQKAVKLKIQQIQTSINLIFVQSKMKNSQTKQSYSVIENATRKQQRAM